MTEDEKILQEEFQKRWKRSPQKDGCLFSGFIALCLAQTLFAPDFPFRGLNLGDSAFCLGACLVVDVLVGMKRKGIPVHAFGLLLVGYGIVVAVLGFAVTVPGLAFSLTNQTFWLKVLLGCGVPSVVCGEPLDSKILLKSAVSLVSFSSAKALLCEMLK